MTAEPATTGSGVAVLISRMSACCWTGVLTVAELLPGVESVGLDTVAVFGIDPVAVGETATGTVTVALVPAGRTGIEQLTACPVSVQLPRVVVGVAGVSEASRVSVIVTTDASDGPPLVTVIA